MALRDVFTERWSKCLLGVRESLWAPSARRPSCANTFRRLASKYDVSPRDAPDRAACSAESIILWNRNENNINHRNDSVARQWGDVREDKTRGKIELNGGFGVGKFGARVVEISRDQSITQVRAVWKKKFSYYARRALGIYLRKISSSPATGVLVFLARYTECSGWRF